MDFKKALVTLGVSIIAICGSIFFISHGMTKRLSHQAMASITKADRLVNYEEGIVEYRFESLSGERFVMTMDYEEGFKWLSLVQLSMRNPPKDGEFSYLFKTREGPRLKAVFTYKDRKLKDVSFDVEADLMELKQGTPNRLVIISQKGYGIVFEFYFAENEIATYRMYPEVNPFL